MIQCGARGIMLFLFTLLTSQTVGANVANGKMYEKISAISLHCRDVELGEGVGQGGCAITAAAESIYNFGFVVQEQTCLVCRAGGMLGDAGPRLNIKTVLSTYGDFHVKDKTAVRTSYL